MKLERKCTCCNREASGKYKSRPFCNDCMKKVRRAKTKYVWAEKLAFSIGKISIRVHYPVKLK